jgi:hypothetical protein
VRQRIEALFGPCRARDATPLPEGPLNELPQQVIASYAIAMATEREWSALRVAAAAWEASLRKQSRAYVEVSPDGTLRAVLFGSDSSSLVASRDVLHVPLADADFRRARAKAGEKAKMIHGFAAQYRTAQAKDEKTQVRIQLQSAIDRLRFEAEGGQALLDQLETLTPDDVAAAAKKFLTAEVGQVRQVKPE